MKRIFAVRCALAFVVLHAFSCSQHNNHDEGHHGLVSISLPKVSDTTIYTPFIGQIRSIRHIELRAIEEGYLEKIYVDEGDWVKEGQLLFQIKPVIYAAEKERAEAEVEFARIEYLNTRRLADSNIVSPNELALAKANLKKAEAALMLANAHLSFTQIKAPFDGIVGRFNDVRNGSLLEEGELLSTLSDNSKIWVYFNVSEVEYLRYKQEQKQNAGQTMVRIMLADGGIYDQEGEIETIEADFNNETGNIAFRATFNNADKLLRHGQTCKVLLPVSLRKALLVPQMATFEVLDKKYVYVIKQGRAKTVRVDVGAEIPHLYEVTNGLSPTDTILVDGLRKVKNGDLVTGEFKPFHTVMKQLNELRAE